MKKIIYLFSFVAVIALIAACNSKSDANTKSLAYTDTLGLADFQAWKMQNELKDPRVYYIQGQEARTPVRKTSSTRASKSGSMNSASQYPAKTVVRKKGWSKAAKGGVIGAGSGAVLGAVINRRNRVAGGVIGGILGGGLGYVLGRNMDKKDGRY